MAETKKTKTEEVKAAPKATVKKAVAKKAETKTAETKAAAPKKAAAKTTTAKTTAAKAATKKTTAKKAADVKETISIQFAGKEYTTEQLVKIAKDIWEFDLKKDPADFAEVQLYVKPEEAKAYYVINGTETGSFDI